MRLTPKAKLHLRYRLQKPKDKNLNKCLNDVPLHLHFIIQLYVNTEPSNAFKILNYCFNKKSNFSILQPKKRASCFLEPVLVTYNLLPLYRMDETQVTLPTGTKTGSNPKPLYSWIKPQYPQEQTPDETQSQSLTGENSEEKLHCNYI